jgi:hypothetical protein
MFIFADCKQKVSPIDKSPNKGLPTGEEPSQFLFREIADFHKISLSMFPLSKLSLRMFHVCFFLRCGGVLDSVDALLRLPCLKDQTQ